MESGGRVIYIGRKNRVVAICEVRILKVLDGRYIVMVSLPSREDSALKNYGNGTVNYQKLLSPTMILATKNYLRISTKQRY